jgi:hypothetical protein
LRRTNLETGRIEILDIENAKKQIAMLRNQKSGLNIEWENMGPTNIGGRCRAILFDKNNVNTMYAGGVSGGLWKSTTAGSSWTQVVYAGDAESNSIPNLNISSICQTANNHVYFGTGEGFYIGYGTGSRGFEGAGIWKSTDGETFQRLESTWSTTDSKNTFVYVNKLAAHPTINDKIYAATCRGLQISTDGGATWTNNILNAANMPITENAGDVKISSDGNVVIADVGINAYVSSQGGVDGTWVKVTGSGAGQLPLNSSRTEFAIAPSNSSIIYAQATKSDGSLLNIYRSDDKGINWYVIGPGGSTTFNPLGDQGTYDNTIAVFPDNADQIIVGGQLNLWYWGKTEGWKMLTFWSIPSNDLQYVHADQHALVFHPTNSNIVFCGSDGGIHRSLDRGLTWQTRNKNFNITQFYAIAPSPTNEIIGGTQDNGTIYMDPDIQVSTGTPFEFYEVSGGDGGYAEISQINPNIVFSTVYYSTLYRSEEKGAENSIASFYSARVTANVPSIGDEAGGHPFVTPIALFEDFNAENSLDYVYKVTSREYLAGEVVDIESNVPNKYFYVTLDENVPEDDTIWAHDTYQSQFATGFNGSVWVTRDALSMRKSASWLPVIEFPGEVPSSMEWSGDGDVLYIATQVGQNSNFYRVKGFVDNRLDSLIDYDKTSFNLDVAKIASFSNRAITGIGVDPEFAGNVVVTLGNYGSSQFVYYSTSANVAPAITSGTGNFVSKQGNLPAMPVYDAVVLWNDSRKVIVGTEFGVYSTSDITATTPVWNDENQNGFDYVATYSLRQQTHRNGWIDGINADSGVRNHGYIWAGTHGRGIFVWKQNAGPTDIASPAVENAVNRITVFPNPASETTNFNFSITEKSDVQISVFDVQGKLVNVESYKNLASGRHTKEYNCSNMNSGIYLVRMRAGDKIETTKLIVK